MYCQHYLASGRRCAHYAKVGQKYCWQHLYKAQQQSQNRQRGGNQTYRCGNPRSPFIHEICLSDPDGEYQNVIQCLQQCKLSSQVNKLIAFDFDLCVTSRHTVGQNITENMIQQMLIHDIYRLASELFRSENFLRLFQTYYQQHSYRFVITSYGQPKVIAAFLKRLGIYQFFDLILTPSSFGLVDGSDQTQTLDGKNGMLNFLRSVYNLNPGQILLIDDSSTNTDRAQAINFPVVNCNPTGAIADDLVKIKNAGFFN